MQVVWLGEHSCDAQGSANKTPKHACENGYANNADASKPAASAAFHMNRKREKEHGVLGAYCRQETPTYLSGATQEEKSCWMAADKHLLSPTQSRVALKVRCR